MMKVLITSLVQSVFFPNFKVLPREHWTKEAMSKGLFSKGWVSREGKKISVYVIESNLEVAVDKSLEDCVVLFSHPISKKGKYFFTDSKRADYYLNRGCTVVAFDYNGFGESDRIDLFYWKDARSVIKYIKEKYPEKKIILHGTSFGAFHIIRSTQYLPLKSKVVLENVNQSLLGYWGRWPIRRLMVNCLVKLKVNSIQDMDVISYVKFFERSDIYFQFLACEKDEMTTPEEMKSLFEQLGSKNKSYHVFPDVGHLKAPEVHPDLYEKMIMAMEAI